MKPLEHPTELQLEEFSKEFTSMSDRALVISCVSMLDSAISELLRIQLLTSRNRDDELFGPDRPLGSFSAKIDLAYRLRLIDAGLAEVLHCCRKIRNEYAHLTMPGKIGVGKQGKELRAAESTFRKEHAIWWDAPANADAFLFRNIWLHVLAKLATAIEPNRERSFPVLLKPSQSEQEFFHLLSGKTQLPT